MTGLTNDAVARIVIALVAEELGVQRGIRFDAVRIRDWTLETGFDEAGLDLDSLELLACATRVNEFFHLHESGVEDYLLARRSFGEWVEIVQAGLGHVAQSLTFRTSGSTGTPKKVTHRWADLEQEIAVFAQAYAERRRIVALVPAHHIYGFLFTALLPSRLDLPVVDERTAAPGAVFDRIEAGDLVVGIPTIWRFHAVAVAGAAARAEQDIIALTSTEPSPAGLEAALNHAGIGAMHEIYGSTETGGIGVRQAQGAPFELLPYWHQGAGGSMGDPTLVKASSDGQDTHSVQAPDWLAWDDDRRFRPTARRDAAIQVSGTNVFLDRVRSAIEALDWVQQADVHQSGDQGAERLEALVTLHEDAPDGADLEALLRAHCLDRLGAAERPKRYTLKKAG